VTLRTSDPLSSFERLHLEPSRAPKCPILDPLTVLQLSLRSPLTLSVTVGNVLIQLLAKRVCAKARGRVAFSNLYGKLGSLAKRGGDTRRSEDPDSDRGHNSFDRGGLPAPFQAQALKWPSPRSYSIHLTRRSRRILRSSLAGSCIAPIL
jgi:hypothetical protein